MSIFAKNEKDRLFELGLGSREQSVPKDFLDADEWSVNTGQNPREIDFAITGIVDADPIVTGYQYTLDGGKNWSALTGLFNSTILAPLAGKSYAASIRAVNSIGHGSMSKIKHVRSKESAQSIPIPVIRVQDWKAIPNFTNGFDIHVVMTPGYSMKIVTGIEYSIDGGSTWNFLTNKSLGKFKVSVPTMDISYDICLRLTTTLGNSTASDIKKRTAWSAVSNNPSVGLAPIPSVSITPSIVTAGENLTVTITASGDVTSLTGNIFVDGLLLEVTGWVGDSTSRTLTLDTSMHGGSIVTATATATGPGGTVTSSAATATVQPATAAGADLLSARVAAAADGSGYGGGNFIELVLNGNPATVTLDPTKITATATSACFTNGAAGTKSRAIACLSRRFWWDSDTTAIQNYWVGDDGAGNAKIQIVMDRPIYAADTGVTLNLAPGWISGAGLTGDAETLAITTKGDAAYPAVQAHWATPDRRPLLLGNATFEVCADGGHSWDIEQAGKRRTVDAVRITVTNGTISVSQTVTAITNSAFKAEQDAYLSTVFGANFGAGSDTPITVTEATGGLAQPVFAATFDLAAAGFAVGDTLTTTAEVMPHIGNTPHVSDGVADTFFAPQTHKIMNATRLYISYDPTHASATQNGTPSTDPVAAMAAPCNSVRYGLTAAHAANGATYDGVVLMLPSGAVELAGSTAAALAPGVVGLEIIPQRGIAIDAPLIGYAAGTGATPTMPTRIKVYGCSLNSAGATSSAAYMWKVNAAAGNQPAHLSLYMTGSGAATVSGAGGFFDGPAFIMGGNFAYPPTTSFLPNYVVRGYKASAAGVNHARLVLGSDLGTGRLSTENSGSGRYTDRTIRWAVKTACNSAAVDGGSATPNGISHMLCAAMGEVDSPASYGFKHNADNNDATFMNARVSLTAYLGGRFNGPYDHNRAVSGPKWANEYNGCVLGQHNVKGPDLGLVEEADPAYYSAYYRWGQHDQVAYRAGCQWNAVLSTYNSGIKAGGWGGHIRGVGYRYGIVTTAAMTDPEITRPYANPEAGDWTVQSDSAWAADSHTIALAASAKRDPAPPDGWNAATTNIVAGLVPANRLPVPFDMYGTAYPTSGMTEAGPVRR